MLDAAAVAEDDWERWQRHPGRGPAPEPLFDEVHVRQAMKLFVSPGNYGSRGEVHPGIGLTFIDAGQTIVLVTHDPDVATIASRVVTMRDGQIVDDRLARPLLVPRGTEG